MALPVLDYSTWRFKVNQNLDSPGTALACYQQLVWSIKDSMVVASGWTDSAGAAASATTPWTVVASSNGTVADASDNWTTSANLVWGSGAHSWIVLRQTGVNGQNHEFCIDLDYATNASRLTTIWSPANGFDVSSPVTTARPVATDEQVFFTTGGDWLTTFVTFNCALHVQMTDGGECTSFFVYIGNTCRAFVYMGKPKDPVSGWTNPAVKFVAYAGAPLYTTLNDVSSRARANILGSNVPVYLSSLAYVSGMLGQNLTVVNDITGCWPMVPVRLVTDTLLACGLVGTLSDTWWGSTGVVDGDTYPSTGTLKQFLHVGNLIIPWNQSTPLLT